MKFNLAFSDSTYFVGLNEAGEFIKTDDSRLISEYDSFEAAEESEAHEFFKNDTLSVMPIEGGEFSACLGEDENSCVLGCGCVMYRSASYTDREVSITFCPLHDKAEKCRDVLGRLHDLVSELVECGSLEPLSDEKPAMYGQIVDLLNKESLPLFAPGDRVRAKSVTQSDPALTVVEKVKPEPVAYQVWVCVEPVDAEGDNAGEDLDLPFTAVAEFGDPAAAIELATDMHEAFSK